MPVHSERFCFVLLIGRFYEKINSININFKLNKYFPNKQLPQRTHLKRKGVKKEGKTGYCIRLGYYCIVD